jgi:outer membrane protein assembly factor BamB
MRNNLKLGFIVSIILNFTSCSTLKSVGVEGVKEKAPAFRSLWAKNDDPDYDTGNLPIALHSPLIHEGILFAGSGKGIMRAFELESGRILWKATDNGQYHAAPIVYGDLLVYGTVQGRIYARQKLTGKMVYEVDVDTAIESEPQISRGRLFIHTRNHKIFSLDAKTGKILWAYKRSVPFLTSLQRVSRPIIDGNKLFVGFADGVVAAFSVEEGVLLWETKVVTGNKFIDVDSAPLIYQNKLIVGSLSGHLTLLNPQNGMIERTLPYYVGRRPFLHNGSLLLGTSDGELVVLDENWKEVKKVSLGDQPISSIVPWKNGLALSTVGGDLFHLDSLYNILEKKHLGHEASAVFGQLKVSEGHLAFYSSRYRLYVYR